MLKYFLLLIAAFVIALSVAPYIRSKLLRSYAFYAGRWRALLKKWSLALGRYFLRQYKRLELKEPQTDTSTASALGKLTPIRNAENIGLYETELSNKLDDPDVKNIAITGPYGSGKSSIIKTFFNRHPEYRPLYVSLAAFKDDRTINGKMDDSAKTETEEDTISPEQQKVLDDRIEYSILQQLFYHVKGKDVPFSRLKRIRTVKPSKIAIEILKLDQFKMDNEQLNELAGKLKEPQSVIGLIVGNKYTLDERLAIKLLQPLDDSYRKIANKEGKVIPLSYEMRHLPGALQEINILVENHEVKQKEISVTYLKEA